MTDPDLKALLTAITRLVEFDATRVAALESQMSGMIAKLDSHVSHCVTDRAEIVRGIDKLEGLIARVDNAVDEADSRRREDTRNLHAEADKNKDEWRDEIGRIYNTMNNGFAAVRAEGTTRERNLLVRFLALSGVLILFLAGVVGTLLMTGAPFVRKAEVSNVVPTPPSLADSYRLGRFRDPGATLLE